MFKLICVLYEMFWTLCGPGSCDCVNSGHGRKSNDKLIHFPDLIFLTAACPPALYKTCLQFRDSHERFFKKEKCTAFTIGGFKCWWLLFCLFFTAITFRIRSSSVWTDFFLSQLPIGVSRALCIASPCVRRWWRGRWSTVISFSISSSTSSQKAAAAEQMRWWGGGGQGGGGDFFHYHTSPPGDRVWKDNISRKEVISQIQPNNRVPVIPVWTAAYNMQGVQRVFMERVLHKDRF